MQGGQAGSEGQRQLRAMLDTERARLRAVGAGWQGDLPALIGLRDARFLADGRDHDESQSGGSAAGPPAGFGWNLALALCLEGGGGESVPGSDGAALSGTDFLEACDQLAAGEAILARVEVGELALAGRDARTVVAWATSRQRPAEWRERADFDWWSDLLARRDAAERAALEGEAPGVLAQLRTWVARGLTPGPLDQLGSQIDDYYQRRGELEVRRMACQHSYPREAQVGGGTFGFYDDVLARLIGWMLRALDVDQIGDAVGGASDHAPVSAVPLREEELVAVLSVALGADERAIRDALALYTLDAGNAAYHGASFGVAPPPLIRLDAATLAWSAAGLRAEPLIFVTRELRRRHAQEYHNAAHLRETTFRQDLYALFDDRRFVRSARRVELRRAGGDARTDLDALIFDRKTGTLGVFELKSQDPFARSSAERIRQRDYFLQANRQVAATVDWLRQHGGDALLSRVDAPTAKKFRVQRVRHFVLGRYLAQVTGGAEPDRRAAWGTWPQVLRLVGARPFAPDDRNPLDTLFNRLANDTLSDAPPTPAVPYDIQLGTGRIQVFPSFAAYRATGDSEGTI
jgi:hypothetical protein